MAHYSKSGLWTSERNHSPYETDDVECVDCDSTVADADEEYCLACSAPLCTDCQNCVNDEPLCKGCFSALRAEALRRLQRDPLVGDLFRSAA